MTAIAGHAGPPSSCEVVTAPARPDAAPTTPARIASLGTSPNIDDCLAAFGLDLPPIETDRARQAFAHWLRSWAGFGLEADDLADQVAA